MKLLVCIKCSDVFSLRKEERKCVCGKSKGKYLDNLNAEFSGPCLPLGFANSSFVEALQNQPEKDWGKEFTAFVIQKECSTMVRKGRAPKIPKPMSETEKLQIMMDAIKKASKKTKE